jgi:hypothetical protein
MDLQTLEPMVIGVSIFAICMTMIVGGLLVFYHRVDSVDKALATELCQQNLRHNRQRCFRLSGALEGT